MLHPTDHVAYLARHDFVIPPGTFTPAESELLRKYGRWMEALVSGVLAPTTPSQEQFVRVVRGDGEPTTDFERVWAKVVKERGVAEEVVRRFQALHAARAHAAETEVEYLAARQVVLAAVREQLDAVDAAFAEQIRDAAEASAAAEQAVRELVLKLGRSVPRIAGIQAVYRSPHVSWDNEKMAAYAEKHPEVKEFRKVGKPSVALRFGDGDEKGVPAPLSESGETKRPPTVGE